MEFLVNEPQHKKTGLRGSRSDTNQTLQSQMMVRGLKFQILVVKGLYYPYGENKDAEQLCKMPVFSQRGSNVIV